MEAVHELADVILFEQTRISDMKLPIVIKIFNVTDLSHRQRWNKYFLQITLSSDSSKMAINDGQI